MFKNAAPGNLGRPDLLNLPARSKIALPKMPSLQNSAIDRKGDTGNQADDHVDLTHYDSDIPDDLHLIQVNVWTSESLRASNHLLCPAQSSKSQACKM